MCQAGGEKSVLLAARFFHPGRRLDVGVPRRGLARCRPLPGRGQNSLRLGGILDMRARPGRHGVPNHLSFLAKCCREGLRASNVPPNRTGFLARRTSRRARGGPNTQPRAFCGSAGLERTRLAAASVLLQLPPCGDAASGLGRPPFCGSRRLRAFPAPRTHDEEGAARGIAPTGGACLGTGLGC